MASASTGDVGRHLRQLFGAGSGVGLDDGQLLERFAARGPAGRAGRGRGGLRDDPGAARGDGPIGLPPGARRRARRRGRVPGDLPGPGPPGRLVADARGRRAGRLAARRGVPDGAEGAACAARRRARELRAAGPEARAGGAVAAVEVADLGEALHAEVARLPARYRSAVVLCYFEGRTHDEAAAALDWPVGTVRCRLSRARDLLRSASRRRGLAPAVAALGAARDGIARRGRGPRAAAPRHVGGGRPRRAGPGRRRAGRCRAERPDRREMADRIRRVRLGRHGRRHRASGSACVPGSPQRPSRSPVLTRVAALARRPGRTPRRPPARSCPRAAGDDPIPWRRFRRPGLLYSRWEVPGHERRDQHHPRLGRGLGTDRPRNRRSPDRLPRDRALPRRQDAGDERIPEPAPALGRRHRARETAVARGDRMKILRYLQFDRLGFSPDGRTLAVGGASVSPGHQDLREVDRSSGHGRPHRASAPDPVGLALAEGSRVRARRPRRWPRPARTPKSTPPASRSGPRRARCGSGTPRRAGSGGGSPSRARSSNRSRSHPTPDGWPRRSPTARLRLYDLATGREREPGLGQQPADQPRAMNVLRFSPDGSILAGAPRACGPTAGTSRSPRSTCGTWRPVGSGIASPRTSRASRRSRSRPTAGRSPRAASGRRSASGTSPRAARSVESVGHRSAIRALAVSPVDGTVFTGGYDGTIRRWDPASGASSRSSPSSPIPPSSGRWRPTPGR